MKIIIKNRMQNKKNKRQKSNDFQNPCRLLESPEDIMPLPANNTSKGYDFIFFF